MGGLHSGRKREHTCIDDCLVLDTAWLKKQRVFSQKRERGLGAIEWRRWQETDFIKRKELSYRISTRYDHAGQELTLAYQSQVKIEDRAPGPEHAHKVTINLVTTPCNYGGVRYWFLCPDCSSRVRALYIKVKSAKINDSEPRCRHCADLHYPSQMASYIERHKTYERHLLANYGLYWAKYRYDFELKEHYLKMTPELWALRLKSTVDWNMHLLKEVIKCDLLIMRTEMASFRSLRSEEDRAEYLKHMHAQRAKLDTAGFVKILFQCIEFERLIYQVNTVDMPEKLFQIYSRMAVLMEETEERAEPEQVKRPEEIEHKIIYLEAILKEVNKLERKKAA